MSDLPLLLGGREAWAGTRFVPERDWPEVERRGPKNHRGAGYRRGKTSCPCRPHARVVANSLLESGRVVPGAPGLERLACRRERAEGMVTTPHVRRIDFDSRCRSPVSQVGSVQQLTKDVVGDRNTNTPRKRCVMCTRSRTDRTISRTLSGPRSTGRDTPRTAVPEGCTRARTAGERALRSDRSVRRVHRTLRRSACSGVNG